MNKVELAIASRYTKHRYASTKGPENWAYRPALKLNEFITQYAFRIMYR